MGSNPSQYQTCLRRAHTSLLVSDVFRLEVSTKAHLGDSTWGLWQHISKVHHLALTLIRRNGGNFSLTRTLFCIGPLNLGLFSVHDTPSHRICPLSYSHHGLLVSDTLIISFCFTYTYIHSWARWHPYGASKLLTGTFIEVRYMMNHPKVNIKDA